MLRIRRKLYVAVGQWYRMNVRRGYWFSRAFAWADTRHSEAGHILGVSYEVCDDWICCAMFAIENALWYGGKAVI